MKKSFIVAFLFFFAFLFSCNQSSKEESKEIALSNLQQQSPSSNGKVLEQNIPVSDFQSASQDSAPPHVMPTLVATVDWDKKIVKTAFLKIEVTDFKKFSEMVHKTVREYGGYIAREEQVLSDEKSENIISIKVPVEKFETMMNELPGANTKVMERNITTEDVTGQIVDTRSRLEAKKQMRFKYLEFLKQSKNMEEVLQVQGEINQIQEEIESATARLNNFSHQSSLSTINLTFYQPATGYVPADSNPSFFTRVINAFKSGTGWISDIVVALMSIWPMILIILVILFGLRKRKQLKTVPVNTPG